MLMADIKAAITIYANYLICVYEKNEDSKAEQFFSQNIELSSSELLLLFLHLFNNGYLNEIKIVDINHEHELYVILSVVGP